MSKKSSVIKPKKSRRRLKRSVRRTLAAVLMITAIGVAAIPVPENMATETTPPTLGDDTDNTAAVGDVHANDMEKFGYKQTSSKTPPTDPPDDDSIGNTEDITISTSGSWKLDVFKDATEDELFAALEESDKNDNGTTTKTITVGTGTETKKVKPVYASYKIRPINGDPTIIWEFMYYVISGGKTPRGVVCKYNEHFATDEVDLQSHPITSYYTLSEAKYNALYDSSARDTDFKASDYYIDPAKDIVLTYDDYINESGARPSSISKDEWNFLTKSEYCKADYEAACAKFDKYYNWDKDSSADKGDLPDGVDKNNFVVTPNDYINTDALRRQFYVDNAKDFPGSGFTLVSVYDERPNGGGKVYVAQGNEDSIPGEMYSMDKDYYLVFSESRGSMVAIGANAFEGVKNVVNMTIPEMIEYIGDEAFANAGLIETIKIMNVKQLGNRAFKNCAHLREVTLAEGTVDIGAECFYNTAIKTIELPSSIGYIGYGAFADCDDMTSVGFSRLTGCAIEKYAFYSCTALQKVDMTDAVILSIGDGAFASDSGVLEEFIFSQRNDAMNSKDSIGDYMFAGRSSLKTVKFPKGYGSSQRYTTKLPDNMFHGCIYLEYVEFPANYANAPYACAFVEYDPKKLFADVRGEKLYIRGPEEQNGSPDENGSQVAYPRKCTWSAVTAVNGYKVPYLYADSQGNEFFELSDGKYLMCVKKNADGQTGVLTKCEFNPNLTDSEKKDIDLEIKPYVGNIKLTGLAPGCFPDNTLNQAVRSLKIYDDSITEISNGVFKDWKNLKRASIGDSVTAIGDEAFAGCEKLIDVTFSSPKIGYDQFKIGKDAFKTGSSSLTFNGDIVKGYAPFEWATDPDNIIRMPEGIRVCYKSLSPSYLTVMYNPHTAMVTMLDYPKYNQVSSILDRIHASEIEQGKFSSYENMMEAIRYDEYGVEFYDNYRRNFASRWKEASTQEEKEALYNSDQYGPWINSEFCKEWSSTKWLGSEAGGSDSGNEGTVNTLTDWLFEPIVAYAAENPTPYFSYPGKRYDVVNNAESSENWRSTTYEEGTLLAATEKINVPAGVDSIDIYGYLNNLTQEGKQSDNKQFDNRENAKIYLYASSPTGCWDEATENMYTRNGYTLPGDEDILDSVAGLFSGEYDDKCNDEKWPRGNDRIREVTLNSVKYLPDYAFDSCERLTTVILGPECKDIGTAPFRGCTSLQTVGNNDYYNTNNGIVYSINTDGSYTIEECLPARGLLVGSASVDLSTDEDLGKVSVIREGAFEDCDYINFVDLTKTSGLVEIPKNCFRACDNLNRVHLPATVNSIDDGAFVGVNLLGELVIPGKEVFISGDAFSAEGKLATTTVLTSEDSSARRYVDTNGAKYKLEWQKKDNWRVIFLDADLNQIGAAQIVEDGGFADIPEDPVKEDWIFERWLGTNNADPKNAIREDTTFVAKGYSTSSMVEGKFVVDFMDQIDGKIFSTQLVEPGKDAIVPQAPIHAGYTFLKYGGDSLTNIQKNSVALAMYSGGAGVPGGTTNTTSGASSSTTSTSGSSVSGNSTSSTSTTSAGAEAAGKYTVTVINGSGSGTYDAGATVIIAANTPATGKVFKNWTTESAGVTLASVSLSATTFIMPANNVTVTANYVTGSTNALTGTSTNGNTGNNGNDGGTRVDITKPGISNKDLATAKVNGSTDNFVVKISETPEATQAVMNALTNKYGSLDSILYYAMDIALYDSTGAVRISDTTGLTVDITIPIPDALTVFGGNNMAGAVVADRLEDLGVRFSTINGVPCISFTATHFSPYTIYVNTQQLSDGTLDITPKTGDPIHPKWFLSLGLACLSIILFMKRDKKPVKVKAA